MFAANVLTSPIRPIVAVVLPLFFALSGFLVAGSLYRNTVATFVGLRALRIAPALIVEVTLSALVLGPLLTTVPLRAYFLNATFFQYFLNMVGDIHYQLPGLFLNNPTPNVVNAQLWTVPWELRCYLILPIALTVIVKRRALFLGAVAALTIGIFVRHMIRAHGHVDLSHGIAPTALPLAFLAAVVTYNYKDLIRWNCWLCIACGALLVLLCLVPGGDFLLGFPAAYVMVYLGLLNPPKIALLRGADYSYGLYLYGFVIQQAVVELGPWARHWYINLPISLAFGCLFAAISWHVVEKPALRLRAVLPKVERYLALLRPTWLSAS